MQHLPSHKQLLLPVLHAVQSLGGSATPRDVVRKVAEDLELTDKLEHYRGNVSGREIDLFARRIRWVRQDGIRRNFLNAAAYGLWELTAPGRNFIGNIKPGIVITIYETDRGVALWGHAEAAGALIADSSINLILTSPEFPLLKEKNYGNRNGVDYLNWITDLARDWKRMLVDSGSLILSLGPVWQRGKPTQSLYQERLLLKLVDELGYHLAQRFYFHNPGKIPSSEWVTIRRVRVRNVIEDVLWLSKTANPKANNKNVLLPTSERIQKLIAKGGQQRGWQNRTPSGHSGTIGGFGRDNGGLIPTNLITATNSASNDFYHRECRKHGLPIHPARFAKAVPEFFVRFLTDENDVVYDPLSGSGIVPMVCEEQNRTWISSERALAYISGSKFHVRHNYRNLAPHLCPI
jgi:DNA modification methylase